MLEAEAEHIGVPIVYPVQDAHHALFVPVLVLLALYQTPLLIHGDLPRLEHLAGQHRGQGDSHNGRCRNHYGHNPAQLLEQHARDTVEHGKGDKNRRDDQGGCDNRNPHLVGGVDGRLARRAAAVDMLGDILQHHNRVVHHHTDGHREGAERYYVDGTAHEPEVDEAHYEGDGDGDADDEGGAPFA